MACILENIVFYRVLLRLHTTYHSIYSNHEWSPLETYVWWFPVDGDHILSVNPQNHQTLQLFGWFPPFMFSSMQFWFSQHVVSSFVFLNIWYRSVVGVLYHLFQIARAFILIVIIDQSLLSRVEAESNPKQRAVWQGPAVALCLPSPSFVLPPPRRNIGKHAGAHGCEFLMVHALSGFCSAQSKLLGRRVSGVPQPENSSQTTSVPWARKDVVDGRLWFSGASSQKKQNSLAIGEWMIFMFIQMLDNVQTPNMDAWQMISCSNQFVSLLKLIFIDLWNFVCTIGTIPKMISLTEKKWNRWGEVGRSSFHDYHRDCDDEHLRMPTIWSLVLIYVQNMQPWFGVL